VSKRWDLKITGYGEEHPEQLLANPHNPRRHDRHQQDILKALLENVGWIQDVIVNERTGNLVDGHLRVTLALRAGIESIPVKYVHLTDEEERVAVATLDAITELAETSEEAFDELLRSIDTGDATLQAFLATLYDAGGSVPDDHTAGDDLTPPRALGKMVWGGHSTLMSRDEQDAIFAWLDAYEAEHGSSNGFIASLLDGKELP